MKLRRFSQLGWHGCMDLVAAAAGHHVKRVELGEAPKKVEGTFDESGPMTTDIVNLVGSRTAGKTERMKRIVAQMKARLENSPPPSHVFTQGPDGEVLHIHRDQRTGETSVSVVEEEP